MTQTTAAPAQKQVGIAYVLWFFFGALGVHKFYLGKIGMGIAYIFTVGFLGIGLLIDLFTLPKQVRAANGVA
ncbi:NINE protein [Actinoplanes sp. NPDC049802]|uniref:TM2 domain-containing protein n=1 Tax=Actinoplanes sp. NPDC049802 TaxID=3154742 RepID=UPI0033CCF5DE